MKKYLLLLIVFHSLIPINCGRETPSPVDTPDEKSFTILNGSVSGILKEADSPYHVTAGLSVDSLRELIIEPGTRIFFDSKIKFIVKGNLLARGTKAKQLLFTSYNDSGWGGIAINGAVNAEFKFCIIEKVIIDPADSESTGAILAAGSNLKMSSCIVQNNSFLNGGGLSVISGSAKISNNIFNLNTADIFGGAISSEASSTEIVNNVFYKNRSNYYGGIIILINNDSSFIQNNIFYKNSAAFGEAGITVAGSDSGKIFEDYNFFDKQNEDPGFTSETDFHLGLSSPCKNAGNPGEEFNDIDGSRNDQGAYGGPLGDW